MVKITGKKKILTFVIQVARFIYLDNSLKGKELWFINGLETMKKIVRNKHFLNNKWGYLPEFW